MKNQKGNVLINLSSPLNNFSTVAYPYVNYERNHVTLPISFLKEGKKEHCFVLCSMKACEGD